MGANRGDAEATLAAAVHRLRELLGTLHTAPLYRTAPVPPSAQPPFLNTAVIGRTELDPGALLSILKALELGAGRRRRERFGPRPLDIDLVLYGDRVSDAPELTLPHPRLCERRFMLEPLAAIAPRLRIPPEGRTVAESLAALDDLASVERIPWSVDIELGLGS